MTDHIQVIDRIGKAATGVATYLNIRTGFLNETINFIASPIFNQLLTVMISLLAITYWIIKISITCKKKLK